VGALGEVVDDVDGPIISLRAVVAATDGAGELRRSITGPLGEAEDLGRRLARTLIADGASALADLSATHPTTASEHAQ
jgi:hydroxymethylbilane synthase